MWEQIGRAYGGQFEEHIGRLKVLSGWCKG